MQPRCAFQSFGERLCAEVGRPSEAPTAAFEAYLDAETLHVGILRVHAGVEDHHETQLPNVIYDSRHCMLHVTPLIKFVNVCVCEGVFSGASGVFLPNLNFM